MDETTNVSTLDSGNGDGGGEIATEADLEEAFAGIAFGILDAVVFGPMRSELKNMFEDDTSSNIYTI